MNKLILLLLFNLPVLANNGFKTENRKIVWERIFPANTDIKLLIESQEKLTLLSAEDGSYAGKGEGVKNEGDINSVRLKCDANFDFTITIMPEGYLVRVTNFMFLEKYGPSQLRVVPASLERYYTEYGKIRQTPKTQGDLAVIDSFLTSVFSGQATSSTGLTSN